MTAECERHQGRVLKSTGDGLLAIFESAGMAVECAVLLQRRFSEREAGGLVHRMGIHLCDVVLEPNDARGDGVNIAARLQEMAHPGTVCISRTTYDVILSRLGTDVRDLGRKQLKNIPDPIGVIEIAPYSGFKLPRRKRAFNLAWLGVAGAVAGIVGLYLYVQSNNARLSALLAQQKPGERVVIEEKPIYITREVAAKDSGKSDNGRQVGGRGGTEKFIRGGAPLTPPNTPTVAGGLQHSPGGGVGPQGTKLTTGDNAIPATPPQAPGGGDNSGATPGSTAGGKDAKATDSNQVGDTPDGFVLTSKGVSLTKLFAGDQDSIAEFGELYSIAHSNRNFQPVIDYINENAKDRRIGAQIIRHVTAVSKYEESTLSVVGGITKENAVTLPATKNLVYGNTGGVTLVMPSGREKFIPRSQMKPAMFLQIGRRIRSGSNSPQGYEALFFAYQLEFGGRKKLSKSEGVQLVRLDDELGPQNP